MTEESNAIRVVDVTLPDGTNTDLLIEGGRFVSTDDGAARARSGTMLIDAAGLIALPGLVDLHAHLREPGSEHSETILSGSRAAAIGSGLPSGPCGFT